MSLINALLNPSSAHQRHRRLRDQIRHIPRRTQTPESQWELEAHLKYEHSTLLLQQSTQPHRKYSQDHREQEESFPSLQLYCSPAKREFWIPFLAPGTALCKIRGGSFKPELELSPLYIQDNYLLCLRVMPCFMWSLSSTLLVWFILLYAAAWWHGASKHRRGNWQ